MNDEFGMMSPEEIERRRMEVEERRRRQRAIRDQATRFGPTVEQVGNKVYGSGGTLLGTMETVQGGGQILNTNKSELSQAIANVQKKIDERNKNRAKLGQPPLTEEEENRLYGTEGVSRVNGQFTYYK